MLWVIVWAGKTHARKEKEILLRGRAMELLARALSPDGSVANHMHNLWASVVLPSGYQVGWGEMSNVYQTYINELPINTRHDIIDRILHNQEKKLEKNGEDSKDIVKLVNQLNVIEIETLFYIMHEKSDIDWVELKRISYGSSELANDIIAFRFRNPY